MNEEEFQQLEDLQVDGFNRWVRYDRSRGYGQNYISVPVSHGTYRNGPVAKVVAAVFWICVAIWLLDALFTIL